MKSKLIIPAACMSMPLAVLANLAYAKTELEPGKGAKAGAVEEEIPKASEPEIQPAPALAISNRASDNGHSNLERRQEHTPEPL